MKIFYVRRTKLLLNIFIICLLTLVSFNVLGKNTCNKNSSIEELQSEALAYDSKGDYKNVLKCINILVDKKNDYGYAVLGWYYELGNGVKQDYNKAYEYYKNSADLNNPWAYAQLAYFHEYSLGDIPWDLEKAFNFTKKASELGDADGTFRLGEYYLRGIGTDNNYKKSFEIFSDLSEFNNRADAQFYLGYQYFLGLGVERNIEKGIYWYERSASTYDYAKEELVMVYGTHEPEKKIFNSIYLTYIENYRIHEHLYGPDRKIEEDLWDYHLSNKNKKGLKLAEDFIDDTIKNNHKIYKEQCAAATFANLYHYSGIGTKVDIKSSVYYTKFLNKYEACNYSVTWNMMGTHYQRGEGYEINYQKSLDFFIETILAGDSIGFFGLGEAYQYGWGIEKDLSKALLCYEFLYRNYFPTHDQTGKPRVLGEIKKLKKILNKKDIEEVEEKLNILVKDYNKILEILSFNYNDNQSLEVKNNTSDKSLNFEEKISKKITNKQLDIVKDKIVKKTSSNDQDPPSIIIDENIIMDGMVAYLEAKVTDESKIAAIFIDGDPIDPGESNDGFVLIKQTLFIGSEDKNLEIVAYDKWGQSSKQSITITKASIDFKKDFGDYYALIIGINKYKKLINLETAVNDAKEISNILKNKYNFKEVVLLLDNDATRENIIKELYNFRKTLKNNDNFLLYYAGHGQLDEEINDGYWQPVNADKDIPTNWINNSFLTGTIKGIKAKHVLVIADSCYSGSLLRSEEEEIVINENNRSKILDRLINKKARYIFTSGGNEPVVDGDGGNHSVFAEKLINALKNNTRQITGSELSDIVIPKVIINAKQTPEYSPLFMTGHDGGDFIFIPN